MSRRTYPLDLLGASTDANYPSRALPGPGRYTAVNGPRWKDIVPRGCVCDLDARFGITLSGNMVTAWTDGVSGLVFSEATNGPTYSASDTNCGGFPSVTFDGSNDLLTSTAAASFWTFMHNGTPMTFMTSIRPTGTGTVQPVFANRNNLAASIGFFATYSGTVGATERMQFTTSNGAAQVLSFFATGVGTILKDTVGMSGITYTESPAGDIQSVYQDVEALAWGAGLVRNTITTAAAPTASDAAAAARLGQTINGSLKYTGSILRLGIWNVVLSSSEVRALHRRCIRAEMAA